MDATSTSGGDPNAGRPNERGRAIVEVRPDLGPIAARTALLRGLLALPHLALSGAATAAGFGTAPLLAAASSTTGRRPRGLVGLQAWVVRERIRAFSYFFLLRPDHPSIPAFGLTDDGGGRHTRLDVPEPTPLGRIEPLRRVAHGLPRLLLGLPLAVVLDLAYPLLAVVVAVRRGWPPGWAARLAALEVWVAEVLLYLTLAADHRPQLLPPLGAPRVPVVAAPTDAAFAPTA